MTATAINLESAHDYDRDNYYVIPNEAFMELYGLIKPHRLRIRRAAAICSSGEAGLVSILPLVRTELVLIDHAYQSLSVGMMKLLLLREKGYEETKRLLSSTDQDTAHELRAALEKLAALLPDVARKKGWEAMKRLRRGESPFFKVTTDYDDRYYTKHGSYRRVVTSVDPKIAKAWSEIPEQNLKAACRKLDKVTFLHGDVIDLAQRGPFDLMYFSNAFDSQHYGRKSTGYDRGDAGFKEVTASVRPGGLIVGCETTYVREAMGRHGWERIAKVGASTPSNTWTYALYRTPVPVEVTVPVPESILAVA